MEKMKVVLTVEQAKALEALKEIWADSPEAEMRGTLIEEKFDGGWSLPEFHAATTIEHADFVTAVYFGYEVDQPLKDAVESTLKAMYGESYDKYFEAPGGTHEEAYYDGFNDAIPEVANRLGLIIEGVND